MLRFIFIVVACHLLLTACQKEPDNLPADKEFPVTLHFSAAVGNDSLHTSNTYFNAHSEDLRISTFRSYLHGFQLINSNSGKSTSLPDTYYLIDPIDGNKQVTLTVPSGNYDRLSFVIGVDSIYNVSGAQAGALDPGMGMFWTWNSGYIMAKLEGVSSISTVANNAFEYHIGGFKGPYNVVRRIELPLGGALSIANVSSIHIGADILSWFSGQNPVRISQQPVVTTPGQQAFRVAENYYNMFRIRSIRQ